MRWLKISIMILKSNPNKVELKYEDSELAPLIESNNLGFVKKFCFAIGGLPYQMCSNALALYISIFLLEVAKVNTFFIITIQVLI